MMMLAFSSIYLITYNNVRKDIDMELHKISDFNQKPNEGPREQRPNFESPGQDPHNRSVSFNLETDNKGNIINSFSRFDMDEEFYQSAKNEALSGRADIGKFKLDGNYWTYMRMSFAGGYKIVFLDITKQQGILTSLIYTFLLVALIMLIVIYFISRFFANKSIKPIQEVFDKQKQFIGDASHELKTPLAVINTNVDVLLSNGSEDINSQSKWLYYIKSEVERMSKLTNDLLYLAHMDSSESKVIFTSFDLSEAVENVILTMEASIFENELSLEYNIEPNIIIKGSIEQIKEVVMILLDNALKYTNEKGRINVSLKRSHNYAALSVTNTGKGISQEYIEKIFDRFYRIDKSRSRNSGGYGLGLSIAKAIVDQHGGKIHVKSVLDQSTSFDIDLPLIK